MSETYDELFLFLTAGANPEVDRVVKEHAGGRSLFVWVPDAATAAEVTRATAGLRLIELYRGFDLRSAGAVIEAANGVPVGLAGHATSAPPENPAHNVMIYFDPEADPAADRIVREHAGGRTTIIPVPAYSEAATLADEIAGQGADLVEICGGTPLTAAAAAREKVGDRAAVTSVTWPFEAIDGVYAFKSAFDAATAPATS
ncbi:hypothetical protein EV193_10558 [Herbihabitans rhizosphaerae]|uniref:Uncharacterized protein n=1 Tax=Herbihabitans rhizosphaerae TaxID=1872711 RepID=A0A4V2ESG6_9PSEU|nr:DUF6506 family protein [Herbihabitans rhizosphaerae]RZS37503.1 hypothetical protein EV193_10558 [Herbihabitans rhizosphaerae]